MKTAIKPGSKISAPGYGYLLKGCVFERGKTLLSTTYCYQAINGVSNTNAYIMFLTIKHWC